MIYPGGKNAQGVFQAIINQIPPHEVYIEAFVGSGAILRNKRPSRSSIAIDADPAAARDIASLDLPGLQVICGDALTFLRCYPWTGSEFVYLDPPYLMSARSCQKPLYRREFGAEEQHLELLSLIQSIKAPIAISGYESSLYAEKLADWRSISYQIGLKSGKARTETLWMNYPQPVALHDYRYLGKDFRERENIRRMQRRWRAKLAAMPAMNRYALLAAMEEFSTIGGDGEEDLTAGNGEAGSHIGAMSEVTR